MLNDKHEPSIAGEEAVLRVLKQNEKLRSRQIANLTGKKPTELNHAIQRLRAAGWIRKRVASEGIGQGVGYYVFVADPREMGDDELAELFRQHADGF